MNVSARRRSATTAVAGLLFAAVAVGVTSAAVNAAPGTSTTTNACFSNATTTYSDLPWTLTGSATPSPVTLGAGDVTLAGSGVQVDVPATLLVAGYNLGLLPVGPNNIPVTVFVSRQATNVDTGAGVKGTKVQVDSFTVTVQTTITDPDGIKGTKDETATPLAIQQALPNMVVTPLGGNVVFSQAAPGSLGTITLPGGTAVPTNGSVYASASVAGGLIQANFDCSPGTTIIDPVGGTSGSTFTPATPAGFENVTVIAPPTAPVCVGESVQVGAGQSATIDLRDNCTDVNEGTGGGSPFTFSVTGPTAGTLTPSATTPGVYTYNAPALDPGAPDIISFTATDTTSLVSNSADVSVTVLANQCDASTASCSLTEIVVQTITGTTMTMDKVAGVVQMSDVTLDGSAQVSSGALQPITVTNARGTAAGWSVTAYATDLGAAGSPGFLPPIPGAPPVPLCSLAGAGPFAADPTLSATIASDRLCIPGDNLGWTPGAAVAHSDIPGDVAVVAAGTPSAADAAAWLALLVAAGNTADPAVGVDGLGGLGGGPGAKTLCSAPVNHSGGTFTCTASLYLGVPASAGAGTYQGGIVLTLA